jgi:hypothetical protein
MMMRKTNETSNVATFEHRDTLANSAIYMRWDGIDGQVTTQGFDRWIELTSFQFGVK